MFPVLLEEKEARRVNASLKLAAHVLCEADLPFLATQLRPMEPVVDARGLESLSSRVSAVEKMLALRPAAKQNKQALILGALDSLKETFHPEIRYNDSEEVGHAA